MSVSSPSRRRRPGVLLAAAALITAGCAAPTVTGVAAAGSGAGVASTTVSSAVTDSATVSASTTGATPATGASGLTGTPIDVGTVLQRSVAASQQVTSLQGEMSVQTGDSGSEKQVASGTLAGRQGDGRLQAMSVDMTVQAKNQDVNVKMLLVDGRAYIGGDQLLQQLKIDKPWLEISPNSDNAQIAALGQQLDSMAKGVGPEQLKQLQQAAVAATEVGPEEVDGIATTHYQVLVDVRRSIEALGSAAPSVPASADLPSTVPTDLWLDDQGRMVKTQVVQEVSGQRLVTTFTITSYDQPVDITAPDPSQVSTG